MLKKIDIKDLDFNPFTLIGDEWALLTGGTESSFNTMTVSWGHLGVIWGTPSAVAYVRTNRHTLSYLENNEYYTISFFDKEYKDALSFCGSHSGRDCDKVKETGLTPVVIENAVAFEEAKLVFVCRKQYAAMLDENGFTDKAVKEKCYSETNPLHKQFIGEIVSVYSK
jgi:flavin reductase (DIM6/NTAB) family NADH-FMN oxidoreductase RutF